jgi:hypothetical protein
VFSDESDDDESDIGEDVEMAKESGEDIMEQEKVGEAEVEEALENGETVGVVLLFLFFRGIRMKYIFLFSALECFAGNQCLYK